MSSMFFIHSTIDYANRPGNGTNVSASCFESDLVKNISKIAKISNDFAQNVTSSSSNHTQVVEEF